MLFKEKTILLRDGRTALFRSPSPDDAGAMIELMTVCSSETDFLLRTPAECAGMRPGEERRFLADTAGSDSRLMIVCEADGAIAGSCQLSLNKRLKTRHRASIALAVRRSFWGLGIGTAMIEEMAAAAAASGVLQLELDWIEGNERAERLYIKQGFAAVAERPDAIRMPDGSMRREISMIRRLAERPPRPQTAAGRPETPPDGG